MPVKREQHTFTTMPMHKKPVILGGLFKKTLPIPATIFKK